MKQKFVQERGMCHRNLLERNLHRKLGNLPLFFLDDFGKDGTFDLFRNQGKGGGELPRGKYCRISCVVS